MPDTLLRLPPGGSWSWRYSKNQMAILALLTRVNRPHHQVSGFDQVMESTAPAIPNHGSLRV